MVNKGILEISLVHKRIWR